MENQPFLVAEQVSYTFPDGQLHVLDDISLTIKAGDFVALLGPSGVGKSTLLRLLGGLLKPTAGRISMTGQPESGATDPIGVVFQRDNLMPWRTVTENVQLPLELQRRLDQVARNRVQEVIELVGLAGFEGSYPAQLSGGMAQRVAIARALVHRPALLLLDEPFGSLDALTRERMGQELLRIWHALPVTVFMVTHSIHEAVMLADEVLVMGGSPAVGEPATLTRRVSIGLPRPRALEIQGTPAFQRCAKEIRSAIVV